MYKSLNTYGWLAYNQYLKFSLVSSDNRTKYLVGIFCKIVAKSETKIRQKILNKN